MMLFYLNAKSAMSFAKEAKALHFFDWNEKLFLNRNCLILKKVYSFEFWMGIASPVRAKLSGNEWWILKRLERGWNRSGLAERVWWRIFTQDAPEFLKWILLRESYIKSDVADVVLVSGFWVLKLRKNCFCKRIVIWPIM